MQKGLITVNGKVVTELGTKIDPNKDVVEVISNNASPKETYAVYKPRDIVCSENESEGTTLKKAFPELSHLNPVGRLDKASEGLLLLSNDGIVTKAVTGNDHLIEKEYIVTVREDVLPGMIQQIEKGIPLSDGMTLPAQAKKIDQHTLSITLKEGRKHQVRRMCDALKMTVLSLKRVRIGSIHLKPLTDGAFRKLTKEEVASLKSSL